MNRALIDSNILIYAHDSSSLHHAKSLNCIKTQIEHSSAIFSMQNYLESYRIWTQKITRPVSSKVAWGIIEYYLHHPSVQTLFPTAEALDMVRDLSVKHNKTGVHIFDVQLVATMLVNGISTIYTANIKDFEVFSEIRIINPLS